LYRGNCSTRKQTSFRRVDITIQINKVDYCLKTDRYGKFNLKLNDTQIDEITYENCAQYESQIKPHTFDYSTDRLLVISDIDDTLINNPISGGNDKVRF